MKMVQIVPRAGEGFYCENCLRDYAIIKALRKAGHDVLAVPLYLPPVTEGGGEECRAPIFFGGINVYLQQKLALFRKTPRWLDRMLDSPRLLRWASRKAPMTKPEELGETVLSMLRGETGRQVKELNRLAAWLADRDSPDVVFLSNAMLVGMARRIREALGVPVICWLQDEDAFLDALGEDYRRLVWQILAERAADVDAFLAVSGYYGKVMRARLGLPPARVHRVYPGIEPEGYGPAGPTTGPPAVGFLARMCRAKGLDTLVEAFAILKGDDRHRDLKLRVAGGKTAADEPFLRELHDRLAADGLADDVELMPDLKREDKQAFLQTQSVVSVPSRQGEAFGLFVLEALASSVPVVLPNHGAFPELVEATGAGLLCEPNDPRSLADGLAELLGDPDHARALGQRGRRAVLEKFSAARAAAAVTEICQKVLT